MSWLGRVRRWFGPGIAEDGPGAEGDGAPVGDDRPAPATVPERPDPETRLEALRHRPVVDPSEVLALVDELAAAGRELRGLELARRISWHHPEARALSLLLARRLAGRGETEAARRELAPALALAAPPLEAWMLAGELAERDGEPASALGLYERVVARDVDHPGARERIERLRQGRERDGGLAGATLLADGALARGRYRVEREIGRGGAGTVFAARDVRLGRHVALKVYHRRGRTDRDRLRVEGRTPARLEHAGVLRIFDLDEGLAAIAMEWLPGGSIRQRLSDGRVTPARAHRWLTTALEALGFVHARGWIHRDLKPSNLLLRGDERVVLTDFGLAARVGETPPLRGGAGEGTLAYMPPEQRAGGEAHPSADVHAFGATMGDLIRALGPGAPDHWPGIASACTRRAASDRPTVDQVLREIGEWNG